MRYLLHCVVLCFALALGVCVGTSAEPTPNRPGAYTCPDCGGPGCEWCGQKGWRLCDAGGSTLFPRADDPASQEHLKRQKPKRSDDAVVKKSCECGPSCPCCCETTAKVVRDFPQPMPKDK